MLWGLGWTEWTDGSDKRAHCSNNDNFACISSVRKYCDAFRKKTLGTLGISVRGSGIDKMVFVEQRACQWLLLETSRCFSPTLFFSTKHLKVYFFGTFRFNSTFRVPFSKVYAPGWKWSKKQLSREKWLIYPVNLWIIVWTGCVSIHAVIFVLVLSDSNLWNWWNDHSFLQPIVSAAVKKWGNEFLSQSFCPWLFGKFFHHGLYLETFFT